MQCLLQLLVVLALFDAAASLRSALETGVVNFNGTTNATHLTLNASQNVYVPHVYQANTSLGLISFTRSNTTDQFPNFLATVTTVEGNPNDTLTISISADNLTDNQTYIIVLQFMRVAGFPTYELQSSSATTNGTSITSNNLLRYTDGQQLDAFLFVKGFLSIDVLVGVNVTPVSNSINYQIGMNPNGTFVFDLLIVNKTALFFPVCTTSKLYSTTITSPSTTWTLPKKDNSTYVFAVRPLVSTTTFTTDLSTNTVVCSNNCFVFALEIDKACLSTFVPANDLQILRGWEIPVIVVVSMVVLGVSAYLIYYLYVLNKREELALGIYEEREEAP